MVGDSVCIDISLSKISLVLNTIINVRLLVISCQLRKRLNKVTLVEFKCFVLYVLFKSHGYCVLNQFRLSAISVGYTIIHGSLVASVATDRFRLALVLYK